MYNDVIKKYKNKVTGEIVEAAQYNPYEEAEYTTEFYHWISPLAFSMVETKTLNQNPKDVDLLLYNGINVSPLAMVVKNSQGFYFPIYTQYDFYQLYSQIMKSDLLIRTSN